MKKLLLIAAVLLAGIFAYPQECGNYIELLGKGIEGQSQASIEISNPEGVDYVVAEAIYKSWEPPIVPTKAKFWSGSKEVLADPENVPINGFQNEGVITTVFRATIEDPEEMIHLDILNNAAEFYSFAVYVHRPGSTKMSTSNGELYHVYQNEDDQLVINIPVPVTDRSRDISLRFGISELNDDSRWAIFRFEANGEEVSMEVQAWDDLAGETSSYTIREVTFENVPGEVDNIQMVMLSENSGGDSFVGGIVLLDLPCEYEEKGMYCTYTQGFYGNKGGKTCMGETTPELIARLLGEEDLVMGGNGNTLTIEKGSVDCILELLPGGGPSMVLDGEAACGNLSGIETNKQGRIRNSLLAQGITLALNLRNSPDLIDFPVDGDAFVTMLAKDCMDPESGTVSDTDKEYAFGMEMVDYLGEGATIGDLMHLVNMALAGEDIGPLGLSQVSDAAALVNEAFDECVVVLEQGAVEGTFDGQDPSEGDDKTEDDTFKKGTTGISGSESGNMLGLYPNPVTDRFYFTLPGNVQRINRAAIFDLAGSQVSLITEQLGTNLKQLMEIDADGLNHGMYILRIDTDAGTLTQKFGVQ